MEIVGEQAQLLNLWNAHGEFAPSQESWASLQHHILPLQVQTKVLKGVYSVPFKFKWLPIPCQSIENTNWQD